MLQRKADPRRNGNPYLSILLADDHPVVRDGLHCILERQPDLRVVGAVGDGSAAIRETERLRPQVVIMDITMPGLNGIEATRVIAERLPAVAVLILSMHSSPIIVRRAIEAGARGYIAKDCAAEEMVRAVRAVVEGQRYIGQGLAEGLLEVRKAGAAEPAGTEILTATERNILKLVAEGQSNSAIAAMIGLSPRTVETYRLRLMRKLGIDNLASLIRYALRHGFVSMD